MKTPFFYILLLTVIGLIIYMLWPHGNKSIIVSKKINPQNLTIEISEYSRKSGGYLKIKGRFHEDDSLPEYVFHTKPFGMGPSETPPMKRISFGGSSASRTEDFFYCLSEKDSLFNSPESFDMSIKDLAILKAADSLLNISKRYEQQYTKYYQSFLKYTKLHFSQTDEGLFIVID